MTAPSNGATARKPVLVARRAALQERCGHCGGYIARGQEMVDLPDPLLDATPAHTFCAVHAGYRVDHRTPLPLPTRLRRNPLARYGS